MTSLSLKVNCGNPVVTLAQCPGVMGSFPPQAQGPMSPRPRAASAYALNFILRPVVSGLHHTWKDWLAYVAKSINSSVCEFTGLSPHYIIFGVKKRLPYDLLSSSHSCVYNVDDYAKSQLKVFTDIHSNVRERLQETSEAMCL